MFWERFPPEILDEVRLQKMNPFPSVWVAGRVYYIIFTYEQAFLYLCKPLYMKVCQLYLDRFHFRLDTNEDKIPNIGEIVQEFMSEIGGAGTWV